MSEIELLNEIEDLLRDLRFACNEANRVQFIDRMQEAINGYWAAVEPWRKA